MTKTGRTRKSASALKIVAPNAKEITDTVGDREYKIHCTFTMSPSVKRALAAWCSAEGKLNPNSNERKPLKESAVIEEILLKTIPRKYLVNNI